MMMTRMILAICILASPLATVQAGEAVDMTNDMDRYQVLVDRNIFSPTRGRQPAEPTPSPEATHPEPRPTTPPDPARDMVLRGLAMRGDLAVAMVENKDGSLHRVVAGDTLANRRITTITLDHIEIEHAGERHTITTGMALTGEPGEAPAARPAAQRHENNSRPSGQSTDRQHIIEQMRLRRLQQLGQRAGRNADNTDRMTPVDETNDDVPVPPGYDEPDDHPEPENMDTDSDEQAESDDEDA